MQYFSIDKKVETQIIEKKSKFIANLVPIQSKQEAEDEIQKVKKYYHDARHNCFAYRIIEDVITERANDDGEPSGTAGAPMLELLRGNNLVNTLIVVTRYFGGILLGTGGLVKAYSEVTSNAIAKSNIIELKKVAELKLYISYAELDKLKHYLKQTDGKIVKIDYKEIIETIIQVPIQEIDIFTKKYSNIPFEFTEIEILNEKYAHNSVKI